MFKNVKIRKMVASGETRSLLPLSNNSSYNKSDNAHSPPGEASPATHTLHSKAACCQSIKLCSEKNIQYKSTIHSNPETT